MEDSKDAHRIVTLAEEMGGASSRFSDKEDVHNLGITALRCSPNALYSVEGKVQDAHIDGQGKISAVVGIITPVSSPTSTNRCDMTDTLSVEQWERDRDEESKIEAVDEAENVVVKTREREGSVESVLDMARAITQR